MTYKFDMESWVKDFVETASASKRILTGVPRLDIRQEKKLDAGETLALTRELETLLSETFDIKMAELKIFGFLPTRAKAAPGAETLVYKQIEKFAQAKRVERFSDDLQLANAQATSDTRRIYSFADAFEISFQDLRAAAMSGVPFETQMAAAARRGIEEAMSVWALYGDALAAGSSITSVYGFLNLDATGAAYVTPTTPITGSWASATPEQIIADINYLWSAIPVATSDVHRPNTLLVPHSLWGYVTQARTYTDMSVKNWCMANLEGLQKMEPWGELDTADSAGTGPRMVAFDSNANTGWIEMPMDITFHAPQERNLAYVVPAESRFGGYVSPYPLSVGYMDGI